MKRQSWLAMLLLTVSSFLSAAHITDRLLVGLYATPDQQRPPIELLESGTALDVQERRNGYIKVKLAGNKEGWVEAIYVMEEKPARMQLLETQASLIQVRRELDGLRQGRSVVEASPEIVTDMPVASKPELAASQRQRYWPFIAILFSLALGVAIGVTVVDFRLRAQLGK